MFGLVFGSLFYLGRTNLKDEVSLGPCLTYIANNNGGTLYEAIHVYLVRLNSFGPTQISACCPTRGKQTWNHGRIFLHLLSSWPIPFPTLVLLRLRRPEFRFRDIVNRKCKPLWVFLHNQCHNTLVRPGPKKAYGSRQSINLMMAVQNYSKYKHARPETLKGLWRL